MAKRRKDRGARRAWDQREDESVKAYAAFQAYMTLGPNRSMLAAYKAATGKVGGKNPPGHYTDWSAKYEWTKRAKAFDRHQAAAATDTHEESMELARRHFAANRLKLAERMVQLALGTKKASMVSFMALREALGLGGMVKPTKLEGDIGVGMSGQVHVYIPDNGRSVSPENEE